MSLSLQHTPISDITICAVRSATLLADDIPGHEAGVLAQICRCLERVIAERLVARFVTNEKRQSSQPAATSLSQRGETLG